MGKNRISGNSEFLTKINSFLTKVLILYPQKAPNNFWFSGLFSGYKTGVLSRNEFRVPQPSSENLFVKSNKSYPFKASKALAFFHITAREALGHQVSIRWFFLSRSKKLGLFQEGYVYFVHARYWRNIPR